MKPIDHPSAFDAETRELRRLIARSRRRIDRSLRRADAEARALVSWRGFVRRYPWPCLLAAAGVGLFVAGGLRSGRLVRWLGAGLFHGARRALGRGVADELGASVPWLAGLFTSRFGWGVAWPRRGGSTATAAAVSPAAPGTTPGTPATPGKGPSHGEP